ERWRTRILCMWPAAAIIQDEKPPLLISPELAKALNEQIGHEFGASLQYISIAAHFHGLHLSLLSKLFMDQAEEERQHALKFVKYVLDTKGVLQIPAIPAPKATFASA